MPSNLRLSAELNARAADGPVLDSRTLAIVLENEAQDFLLGKERWNPQDVCSLCFTARARNGNCFC